MNGCEIVMWPSMKLCEQGVVEDRSGFRLCEDHKACVSKTNRVTKCKHSKADR